jgi:hypothetical protein
MRPRVQFPIQPKKKKKEKKNWFFRSFMVEEMASDPQCGKSQCCS